MKAYIFLAFLISVLFFVGSCQKTAEDFINISGIKKSGDDWKLYAQNLNEENGYIKMHQDKWLMYFLHWRPLSTRNKKLTLEYVRHHMLNFWGEAMNFELTGVEGEIEICGHKGYFTEGTVFNGVVHTRFIVWNCPETNRQFSADCNINLARGTPKDYLELQKIITKTVCCHKGTKPYLIDELPKKYESPKWELSFYLPENWRTADFADKEWFPQRMTKESGSLWTLLTDSQKHLELFWERTEAKISPSLFNRFLQKLSADTSILQDSTLILISDIRLNSLENKKDYYVGDGRYEFKLTRKDKSKTTDYWFKGFLWRKGSQVYFLLASLIKLQQFWGIKNDLTPTTATMQKFLKTEIIPNIKVFDRGK